jgi:hypothetical protein
MMKPKVPEFCTVKINQAVFCSLLRRQVLLPSSCTVPKLGGEAV